MQTSPDCWWWRWGLLVPCPFRGIWESESVDGVSETEQKEDSLPLLSLKRSDPLPFLGEPAMASALAYWICKGFSYGPCSIMAHEKTSHDIQGKSLQQNFSCSAREVWYVLIKWKRHSDGAGEIPVMMLGGRKKSAFFSFYTLFFFSHQTSGNILYVLPFILCSYMGTMGNASFSSTSPVKNHHLMCR